MLAAVDWRTLILALGLALIAAHFVRILWRRRFQRDDPWEDLPAECRLRSLVEGSPVGYMEVDSDGIVRRVNRAETVLRGLSAHQMVGRPAWELWPVAERQRRQEEFFRKLAEEKQLKPARYQYRRRDDTVITLESYESLIRDRRNVVVGMTIGSQDITDRQRNEDEVFQATSELRALLQALPDVFLKLDSSGVILDVKAGQSAGAFAPSQDVVGKRLHQVLTANAGMRVQEAIEKVCKTAAMVVVEYEAPSQWGKEYYEVRLLPVHWGQIIAVLRNITERKKNQDRLEEYAEELEQKNRQLEEALLKATEATKLKSRFLANMSHEIRTPMNGVIGMTDFLLATSLSPEQQEYTESLKSSADALLALLNDILDISKIEAGKLQIESIPFDLAGAVGEVARFYTLRARDRDLSFECDEVPEIGAMAVGDPGRLRQVLSNLIDNAMKFTHRGKVRVGINLLSQLPETVTLRFSVIDTGIGIPAEQRGHLFESFAQGDDTMSRQYGGTGLGLSISKQLVEMMGGHIGVESEPRRGSTFWFTVVFGKHVCSPAEQVGEEASLQGLRVLVADRQQSAVVAKQDLEALGCSVHVVYHGQHIIPALRNAVASARPIRLALVDLDLADLDNFHAERCASLDERLSKTRFIAMTSVPMRGDGLRAHRSGYSGYLVKPVQTDTLRSMIAEVLKLEGRPDAQLVTRHSISERQRLDRKSRGLAADAQPETDSHPNLRTQSASYAESARPVPQPPVDPAKSAARPKARVLVAEDNSINQRITSRLLQKAGLIVDVVANGREAVDASLRTAYDLILMDCQMPVMDGFEATAEIRRREGASRRTPICALTAHAMVTDREKCLAAGMDDYLSKPVGLEQLRETVSRLTQAAPDAPPREGARKIAAGN